uniref:Transducin/WD40 repeat-like superfamily protein n=1 Tax=Quercus lobata TaxID=97700 RepID=A0A7N2RCI1_QUELO
MAEQSSFVNSCCPSRRGPPLVVSGFDDGTAKLLDMCQRGAIQTFPDKYQIIAISFSDASNKIFTGGMQLSLDGQGRSQEYILGGAGDGSYLLTNGMGCKLYIWDMRPYAPQNRCVKVMEGHQHNFEKNLLKCSWSPDGSKVIARSSDRMVYIWDTTSRHILYKLPGHTGSVTECVFHPSEPVVGSCSPPEWIRLDGDMIILPPSCMYDVIKSIKDPNELKSRMAPRSEYQQVTSAFDSRNKDTGAGYLSIAGKANESISPSRIQTYKLQPIKTENDMGHSSVVDTLQWSTPQGMETSHSLMSPPVHPSTPLEQTKPTVAPPLLAGTARSVTSVARRPRLVVVARSPVIVAARRFLAAVACPSSQITDRSHHLSCSGARPVGLKVMIGDSLCLSVEWGRDRWADGQWVHGAG